MSSALLERRHWTISCDVAAEHNKCSARILVYLPTFSDSDHADITDPD